MARLYLFVEGQTEQTFANELLAPHLANHQVYLQPAVLIAHARRKGRVHRGGGRRYIPMRDDIVRFTKQEQGADVFFSTMIDLYALASDFPGLAPSQAVRHDPYQRVEFLEQAWRADVPDRRFLPFIALHEYEAYLFCKPDELELFYPNSRPQLTRLKAITQSHTSPELIDDGPHTAPSKRLIAEFLDYEFSKTAIGPQVAELIGLETIRSLCPHFHRWLRRLESLGGQPAPDHIPPTGDAS